MGRKKAETAEKKKVVFVINKGNKDVEGVAVKMNALNVVIRFMQLVNPGIRVTQDVNNILVVMPDDHTGDSAWLKEQVFRFVDTLGTTDDEGAQERAQKAYERYKSIPHDAYEKVGWSLLDYYLNQFYLYQKAASRFEVV